MTRSAMRSASASRGSMTEGGGGWTGRAAGCEGRRVLGFGRAGRGKRTATVLDDGWRPGDFEVSRELRPGRVMLDLRNGRVVTRDAGSGGGRLGRGRLRGARGGR